MNKCKEQRKKREDAVDRFLKERKTAQLSRRFSLFFSRERNVFVMFGKPEDKE